MTGDLISLTGLTVSACARREAPGAVLGVVYLCYAPSPHRHSWGPTSTVTVKHVHRFASCHICPVPSGFLEVSPDAQAV